MSIKRYLQIPIKEFLEERMVFIGGPRQVGKTTLALQFLNPSSHKNPAYLNWDTIPGRKVIREGHLPEEKIVIFDELHKYKLWRNLIKGFYDGNKGFQNYIVTGSARLDYYRRGGDSLLGRYRYVRLHPLTVAELKLNSGDAVADLLKFGGFPEPYFKQSDKFHRLWLQERLYRVVNDDIRDLESLRDYSRLEILADNLKSRIGSLLSVRSLEEDLQVSQKTVAHWIDILEKVYYCFKIMPFGPDKLRANKKMPKIFLWDWSEVGHLGARFENMVASHLLKFVHYQEDVEGIKYELRFIKDNSDHEIDFILLQYKKPLLAIECKSGDREVSKSLSYFKKKLSIPKCYQVHLGEKDYRTSEGIRVLPFHKFCSEVNLI